MMNDIYDKVLLLYVVELDWNSLDDVAHGKTGLVR
jgi:hypothetical protein